MRVRRVWTLVLVSNDFCSLSTRVELQTVSTHLGITPPPHTCKRDNETKPKNE